MTACSRVSNLRLTGMPNIAVASAHELEDATVLNGAAISYRQAPAYALVFVVGGVCAKALPSLGALRSFTVVHMTTPQFSFESLPAVPEHFLIPGFAIAIATLALILLFRNFSIQKVAPDFSWPWSLNDIAGPSRDDKNADAQKAKSVDRVREGLEKQLSELVVTVSCYLEANSAQSAGFEKVQASLASANTVEQVQAVVEVLISSSAQGQRDAEALRGSLKEAQAQTAALRQRLIKVEKLASLDGLTLLPNRRYFQEFLREAVEESHSDYTPLCVIMADIDHFKKVNDKFGHPTGDAVLKQFADVMSRSVRPTDFVARYGGEEFILVLKTTPMGNALQVAERIRTSIRSAAWKDPKTGTDVGDVTASFGIAEIIDGETADHLVERADKKLYLAKKNGRNRVEIDTAHQ